MIRGPQSRARVIHSGHEITVERTGCRTMAFRVMRVSSGIEHWCGYAKEPGSAREFALSLRHSLDRDLAFIGNIGGAV
jgi:hypothetical protein